jgi:hypothetical protein
MQVILVSWVVDTKRIIGKNGQPRRRRGSRGCWFCFKKFLLKDVNYDR